MMVSTTEAAGNGGSTRNGSAANKNQPKPNNKKAVGFKGDAKTEVLFFMQKSLQVDLVKLGKS